MSNSYEICLQQEPYYRITVWEDVGGSPRKLVATFYNLSEAQQYLKMKSLTKILEERLKEMYEDTEH